MTDLATLERLAKAEAEAKLRISEAEAKAVKSVADAIAEAERILASAKAETVKFRDSRKGEIKKEGDALEARTLASRRTELDVAHPQPNPRLGEAARKATALFEEWLASREVD